MNQAELESLLSSLLARRMADDQPTIINLEGDATMYRPYGRFIPTSYHLSLDALYEPHAPWRPVGRLARILEPLLFDSAIVPGGDGWGEALLPYLTLFACDWAVRLAGQMNAELSCSAEPIGSELGLEQDYRHCLADVSQASGVTAKIMEGLVRSVQGPRSRPETADSPAMLQLQRNNGTVQAIWRRRDGKELRQETLDALASRMSSDPQVAALLEEAKRLESRRDRHRDRGDRRLQAVCPQLADAVSRARANGRRCVGYRMCAHKVRGLPAEVYLFVGPGLAPLGSVSASLVARRAHEEFVLENHRGEFFYFPPIQLMATIEFLPKDLPWHVPVPMVRMPAGGPAWVHPYTGPLCPDRFGKAELISPQPESAMAGISEEARRMLPNLGRDRLRVSSTGCMCLGGQEAQTAALSREIYLAVKRGKKPDLLKLVWGIWNVIRVGLTRAHQDNTNSPVAELGSARMPYPIASAELARTRLTRRIFPYHRN